MFWSIAATAQPVAGACATSKPPRLQTLTAFNRFSCRI
jgi:hypothetical protein